MMMPIFPIRGVIYQTDQKGVLELLYYCCAILYCDEARYITCTKEVRKYFDLILNESTHINGTLSNDASICDQECHISI